MKPLDGYTVVALEQAVAGPLASRSLADLGARVIKVEHPVGGDFARDYDHVVAGTGAHFVWVNRGKESLALDLKTAIGRTVVNELVARADVFFQNLGPGAADRLGFGAEALRARNPALVVVNLSGFGSGGSMETRKAYDLLIQAEAGMMAVTGTPESAVKTGFPAADIAAGMYCAQAALGALLRRERTGQGATVEVSMLEAATEWMGYAINTQLHTGHPPPRLGVGHATIAPYDSYPTRDGHVLIGVQNDRGWRVLTADVLGDPALATDVRFVTNVDRVRHREACDAAVGELTSRWDTPALLAALAARGIPAAQILDVADVVAHPQLRQRDRWRRIGTEHAEVDALLPPATFQDFEAPMGDVPALGRHTVALMREAGIGQSDIDMALGQGTAVQA